MNDQSIKQCQSDGEEQSIFDENVRLKIEQRISEAILNFQSLDEFSSSELEHLTSFHHQLKLIVNEVATLRSDQILRAQLGPNVSTLKLWWQSPNKGLGGKRPIDCHIREVYNYLKGTLGPW